MVFNIRLLFKILAAAVTANRTRFHTLVRVGMTFHMVYKDTFHNEPLLAKLASVADKARLVYLLMV